MEREPKNTGREATDPYGEPWRTRVAADLMAYAAEQQRLWGGIDEMTLARYEAGVLPPEELVLVQQAIRDHPALRECLELSQSLHAEGRAAAPVDATQPRREGGKPWADRTDRPDTGLRNPR